MHWTYSLESGALSRNGFLYGYGFSGAGAGRNRSDMTQFACMGAMPAGTYRLGIQPTDANHIALIPVGHQAFGRKGLHLSGFDPSHPTLASAGALVLPRVLLARIITSGLQFLLVSSETSLTEAPQAD